MAKQFHIKALTNTVSVSIIGSLMAIIGDIVWLFHDIYHAGFKLWYIIVFIFLSLSLYVTIIALYAHFKTSIKSLRHEESLETTTRQKCSSYYKQKVHLRGYYYEKD